MRQVEKYGGLSTPYYVMMWKLRGAKATLEILAFEMAKIWT